MNQPKIDLGYVTLPMREHLSKAGNTTYVVAPKSRSTGSGFRGFKFGTEEELPGTVTFHGDEDVTVPLELGMTDSGNLKTSGTATVTVGEKKFTLHVQASKLEEGHWLILKAIPQGSGGGQKALSASDF